MSLLSERLQEIVGFYVVSKESLGDDVADSFALQIGGAQAIKDVPALIRAIRVLVEQRDRLIENSLRERVILPDTFDAMFSHRVGASNAAVLAAMDAKETT